MSDSSPAVLPRTRPVAAPRQFGKYVLLGKLAEGGMAEIFLAKQIGAEGFERDVVIKCMLEHFSQSPEFVSMFLDEARLAAKLHHPNIVQITDLGLADERYFICMEYLAGEDLESLFELTRAKGERVPIAVAARIILSVLEGLEFAHGYQDNGQLAGLVHRDISPSNIFVTFQGTVKVLDFGIAKASTRVTQTQPGLLKGKLGYMSPEQARGEAELDGRSDLFALGVTFHELLTGQRLFARHHEVGVLLALLQEPVSPPSTLRPDIPPALDRIIMKALERDREARYASAAEMRADLEDFLRTTPSVPGVSQLARYMQELFGPETVQRKTKIPSLSEFAPVAAVPPPQPAPREGPGFERTLLRPSFAGVPAVEPTPTISAPVSPLPVEAPTVARGGGLSAVWGALAAVALLGLGGGATWYFTRASAPPAPLPASPPVAAVQTPPPAAVAPEPVASEPVAPEPVAPEPQPVEATPDSTPAPTAPPEPVRVRAIKLTSKEVNGALRKHSRGIVECGEQFRTELPESRLVKVQMTVKNSGEVREVKVSEPAAARLPSLARCLEGQLARAKFPRNSNQPELTIELPLRFKDG